MKAGVVKAIIFVRHAKASPKDLPIPDKDRPLRESGRSDLMLLKASLVAQSIKPEHIFSSSANRAAQTGTILAGFYGLCNRISFFDDLYHNSENEMLDFIKQMDDELQRIMLVGHNPELEDLVNLLYQDQMDTLLPTSACVCLSFKVDRWKSIKKNSGKVEYYEYPKKHKKEL